MIMESLRRLGNGKNKKMGKERKVIALCAYGP